MRYKRQAAEALARLRGRSCNAGDPECAKVRDLLRTAFSKELGLVAEGILKQLNLTPSIRVRVEQASASAVDEAINGQIELALRTKGGSPPASSHELERELKLEVATEVRVRVLEDFESDQKARHACLSAFQTDFKTRVCPAQSGKHVNQEEDDDWNHVLEALNRNIRYQEPQKPKSFIWCSLEEFIGYMRTPARWNRSKRLNDQCHPYSIGPAGNSCTSPRTQQSFVTALTVVGLGNFVQGVQDREEGEFWSRIYPFVVLTSLDAKHELPLFLRVYLPPGATPEKIAQEKGVEPCTVHNQLRHLLAKIDRKVAPLRTLSREEIIDTVNTSLKEMQPPPGWDSVRWDEVGKYVEHAAFTIKLSKLRSVLHTLFRMFHGFPIRQVKFLGCLNRLSVAENDGIVKKFGDRIRNSSKVASPSWDLFWEETDRELEKNHAAVHQLGAARLDDLLRELNKYQNEQIREVLDQFLDLLRNQPHNVKDIVKGLLPQPEFGSKVTRGQQKALDALERLRSDLLTGNDLDRDVKSFAVLGTEYWSNVCAGVARLSKGVSSQDGQAENTPEG